MIALHNPHKKARKLIQLKLDGLLGERDANWLHAHLGECDACRDYAGELRGLDQALRLDFHAQQEREHAVHAVRAAHVMLPSSAAMIPSTTQPSPGSALYPPSNRKRADMITGLFKSTANTLVSIALLAALAAGLIWLFSSMLPNTNPATGAPQPGGAYPSAPGAGVTRNAYPYPGVQVTEKALPGGAYPAPNASLPSPTETAEIEDRQYIIALLMELAEKEAVAYRGTTWVHRVTQDITETGSQVLPGAFIDAWVHVIDGQCQEMIVYSSDRPDKSKLYSLLVGLPDGLSGDLVALRQGEISQVQTDWTCAMQLDETEAGMLAARLKSGPEQKKIKGPNDLKRVRAWYEDENARSVLVVEAIFTAIGNTPEVQRETRRFELATGRMIQEHIWMEWADGSPFGETSRSQLTELLSEMPAEQAALFEQAEKELWEFQQASEASVTPAPTLDTGVLDTLEQYTAAAPLTDAGAIQIVLQALLERHVEWLANPGWTVHGPGSVDGRKWDDTYSTLLHTLPDESCEMMTYYIKDGAILPQELALANGDWGLIGSVEMGVFTEGKPADQPCRLENFWTVQMLGSVIGDFGDPGVGTTRKARAWTEARDGRMVLVVYDDVTYDDPKPTTMDPDTRRLEPMARSEAWEVFDLGSGAYAGGANQVYLANGKIFGLPYGLETVLDMQTLHLDALPDELQQAFEGVLAALQAYLGD